MWLHVGPVPSAAQYDFFELRSSGVRELERKARALILKDEAGPKDLLRAACAVLSMIGPAGALSTYLAAAPATKPATRSRAPEPSTPNTPTAGPALCPILPLQACTSGYADHFSATVENAVRCARKGERCQLDMDMLQRMYADLPNCFEPPYKQRAFMQAVVSAVRAIISPSARAASGAAGHLSAIL